MGYYDRALSHAEKKKGSMNSTSNEKGTDGKNNNTSAYNHDYYLKNKDKWGVGQTYSKNDKDFDESNYDDKDAIGDTDFYLKKRGDGSFYVLLEDTKWNIPKGADVEALKKSLQTAAEIEDVRKRSAEYDKIFAKYNSGEKEFDVDAAARDVIRGKYKNGAERKAALGADYEIVQKRVNEMMRAKHSDEDGEYLEHHGILGQKWGVRRFQREDGTRTPAGKKRENEDNNRYDRFSSSPKSGGINKKKLAKGLAIAGGVAAGAFLMANPRTREALKKYGTTAITKLGSAAGTIAGKSVNGGKALAKKTGERLSKVGDAMVDAALLSSGGVAINEVTKRLDPGENATESQKNTAKILTDTVTAGIKTATGAGSSSNNGNGDNKGGSVGKEITDKLGSPTHKAVDTSSPEYQNLINSTSDKGVKNQIKSLRKQGYDLDQLQKAMDELKHSMFEDWATRYMGVEIGVM